MTSSPSASASAALDAVQSVAATLPATAPPPEPARKIGFVRAVFLYGLFPKRYGPHLAVGPFCAAFLAHVLAVSLCLIVLLGSRALPWFQPELERTGLVHTPLRESLADVVLEQVVESASGRGGSATVVFIIIFGSLPALELLILLAGTATMPFAAGGDRASSVWKRSVKNMYWCTVLLAPGAALFATLTHLDGKLGGGFAADFVNIGSLILFAVLTVLLLRAALVGAHRYVGPADGPAFAPREPHCDECGYLIIGLPLDTRCPECGLPVRESLVGGRRGPTAWGRHEFKPRGFVEALRMQWAVLRKTAFFRGVPVHTGLSAAKHFWWVTWATFILATLVILRSGMGWAAQAVRSTSTAFGPSPEDPELLMAPLSLGCMLVPLLAQSLVMSCACLWAQVRHRIRDYRVSAATCYYASPLMWPFVLSVLAVAVLSIDSVRVMLRILFRTEVAGVSVSAAALALGLAVIAAVASLVFWWFRLLRALKAVRFANV